MTSRGKSLIRRNARETLLMLKSGIKALLKDQLSNKQTMLGFQQVNKNSSHTKIKGLIAMCPSKEHTATTTTKDVLTSKRARGIKFKKRVEVFQKWTSTDKLYPDIRTTR